ncbi:hypothetical protein FJT64_026003 [Amphibalanus amphitrite]|uniref:Uncharacterized protein n=1 Tax=Amphibalanus amphitrite TaxID=1232801 RepID=A0A6A4W5V5_AMPAM|nr:hypothetical protein FJT64_026003 [Amphibalanus amphitrite]
MNMSTLIGDFDEDSFLECCDHTGEIRIGCDVFGDKMEKIVINGIYTFTHLIREALYSEQQRRFRLHIKANIDLVLTEKSQIIRQPEMPEMPYRTYNFTEFKVLKDLISQNPNQKDLGMHDLIGMCITIGNRSVDHMTYEDGSGSSEPVTPLVLVDESTGHRQENGITLALVGKPALEMDQLLQNDSVSPPFVVVAKNGRLKGYYSRFNSGITNMVLIPDRCELSSPLLAQRQQELKKWYDEAKKERENAEEERKDALKQECSASFDEGGPERAQTDIKEEKN